MQPNATLVFQSCLRRNREAARFFDVFHQKRGHSLPAGQVEHLDAFVRHLPNAALVTALFFSVWTVIHKEIHRPSGRHVSAKKSVLFKPKVSNISDN